MEDFLIEEFYKKARNVDFSVLGILGADDRIHTLGTDSKIIGRVFEILVQPILEEIAEEHGMCLETPKSQTIYPDFILRKKKSSNKKIAVDVKTTYITDKRAKIKFTLGSYGSYMRNNTKNIEYEYTDYVKHYVIGFVYKRNGKAQESLSYDYQDRKNIVPPYYDVQYFIQEKYKIAGDKPGSGDTENIGSFDTKDFKELKEGKGPFNKLGEDIFELYWKFYPKYRMSEKYYTSLPEFFTWFLTQEETPELLHPYDYKQVVKKIREKLEMQK